tara:strand:+ start:258 stop:1547 length:1290 start_codon:yes stop_codon:yes gene_type:complete
MVNILSPKFFNRANSLLNLPTKNEPNTHIKPEKVFEYFKIVSAGKSYFDQYRSYGHSGRVNNYRQGDEGIKQIIGIKGYSIWDWCTKYNNLSTAISTRFLYFIKSLPDELGDGLVELSNQNKMTSGECFYNALFDDFVNKKIATLFNYVIRKGYTDFSNSDLKKLNLSNMTFKSHSNEYFSLRNCKFGLAIFKNCNFTNVDFSESSLNASNFSGSKFTNCKFDKTIIDSVNFANCQFTNCSFDSCKIDNFVRFSNARFSNVTFHNSSGCFNLKFAKDIENLDLSHMKKLYGLEINESHVKHIQLPNHFSGRDVIILEKQLLENRHGFLGSPSITLKNNSIKVSEISDEKLRLHILNNEYVDYITTEKITKDDEVILVKDADNIRIYTVTSFKKMLDSNYLMHPTTKNYFGSGDIVYVSKYSTVDINRLF